MSTSITLELESDDPVFREQIDAVKALGEHSPEYMEILAAIHQFEANRLIRRAGEMRAYNTRYPRSRTNA
jgi:hypothetical protein